MNKTAVILGGLGFIGSNMAVRLKELGYWVRVVDIKEQQDYGTSCADEVLNLDLRVPANVTKSLTLSSIDNKVDEVYQFAADMGGCQKVFTGEFDSDIMTNSALINLNVLQNHGRYKKILYSSSACVYPQENQIDPSNPNCKEDSAYPANPDSDYGLEKLFSERLYLAYRRNYSVDCKIVRFHNIYGCPNNDFSTIRSKAPAGISFKVINAEHDGVLEIFGPGNQTRSFCWIGDAIDGCLKLLASETFIGPLNIGSEEMISINDFTKMIIDISGRTDLTIKNVPGPVGVMGRNSDNSLCREKLKWEPSTKLRDGMEKMFSWIKSEVKK